MPKKIKVRLLDKVNSYRLGDTSYKPGDVFEIPSRLFRPDFFEKVEPPKKKEPEPVPIPLATEEAESVPIPPAKGEAESVPVKEEGKKSK